MDRFHALRSIGQRLSILAVVILAALAAFALLGSLLGDVRSWIEINVMIFAVTGFIGAILSVIIWLLSIYLVRKDPQIPKGQKRRWLLLLLVLNLLAGIYFNIRTLFQANQGNDGVAS